MITYAPWLVWLIPIVSSVMVPLVTKIKPKAKEYFAVAVATSVLVLAFLLVFEVNSLSSVLESSVSWIPLMGLNVGVLLDPLSALFTVLIAFMGLVVIIYSWGYMKGEEGLTRYYFLLLLFIGSMIALVISNNILQMFIFWELVGMCSYGLISFWYKRPESLKAGKKVFLMTRIGDVCLLAAIALLYINSGTFSFTELIANVGKLQLPTLSLVSFLVLAGAVAKSAQFPMHTWLFSAMAAPTTVSCLLHSATMVKAGVFLLARVFPMFYMVPMWLTTISWIGVTTSFIGATLAFHTTDIKGVAAFSTISQIGLMFLAIGVSSQAFSEGLFSGLYHLLNHAFFQGLDFFIIGIIVHRLGTRDMRLMGGLRKSMPVMFALSLIVFLSRAGIPPLGGFFSKDLIAETVFSSGNVGLTMLLYIASIFTFAYSLRYLTLVFLGKKSGLTTAVHQHEPPRSMVFPAVLLGFLCVFSGFLLPLLIGFMHADLLLNVTTFAGISTMLFIIVFLVGGVPVYMFYFGKPSPRASLNKGVLAFLSRILGNGFHFDFVYEKIVASGVLKLGEWVSGFVETSISVIPHKVARGVITGCQTAFGSLEKAFDMLPLIVAKGAIIVSLASNSFVEKAFDALCYSVATNTVVVSGHLYTDFDLFLDKVLTLFAGKVVSHESKLQKMQSSVLPRFVVSALLGFLAICILILLTVLWVI